MRLISWTLQSGSEQLVLLKENVVFMERQNIKNYQYLSLSQKVVDAI
jgi:hypothetical protein